MDIDSNIDANEKLQELLQLISNVAVGIGSGMQKLKYKVHAASHRCLCLYGLGE